MAINLLFAIVSAVIMVAGKHFFSFLYVCINAPHAETSHLPTGLGATLIGPWRGLELPSVPLPSAHWQRPRCVGHCFSWFP